MEKKNKSKKHSLNTVFRIVFFFIIVFYLSCSYEWQHEIQIVNNTADTIGINFSSQSYSSEIEIELIPPHTTITRGSSREEAGFDLFRSNYACAVGDTVELYRNDTLFAKWGGPLQDLPISTHSFYNKNSWEMLGRGKKSEWIAAVFTITEDDF